MYRTIKVHDILMKKGHGYLAIPPDATAYAALEIMADHNVGALLVLDEGKLVGIFSERDYARKVILKGKSSRSTTAGELMSAPPITASPDSTLQECMALMTNNSIRHLPIMELGAISGIVSLGDVVKAIIQTQDATINQLEEYISGDIFPPYVSQK